MENTADKVSKSVIIPYLIFPTSKKLNMFLMLRYFRTLNSLLWNKTYILPELSTNCGIRRTQKCMQLYDAILQCNLRGGKGAPN